MKPNRSSSNNWGHYLKWKTQVFIILVGLRESEGTSERFEGMFLHYVPLLSDVRSLRSLKLSPGAILFLHTLTGCKVLAPATLTSCIPLLDAILKGSQALEWLRTNAACHCMTYGTTCRPLHPLWPFFMRLCISTRKCPLWPLVWTTAQSRPNRGSEQTTSFRHSWDMDDACVERRPVMSTCLREVQQRRSGSCWLCCDSQCKTPRRGQKGDRK